MLLKNPKTDPLGLSIVFYKPKTSKNSRGYPLIEFKSFRKMSQSAEKTARGGAIIIF